METDAPPLLPVEPGYKNVLRVRFAVGWLVLSGIALIISKIMLVGVWFLRRLADCRAAVAIAVVAVAPQRTYRRLRYRLTDRILQVVRGWLFHTDTIVPLVRVQHLDVVRGPLDKMFGTASLVLHTAGTHNSIVTVPGLSPERATEIRDIIRDHVRTDFA